jgi:hypothetical protein
MDYDAFISYSHAADGALAPALQRGLQRLARPWHHRRALEVFRDQTGPAVSPALWSSIRAALDESEVFRTAGLSAGGVVALGQPGDRTLAGEASGGPAAADGDIRGLGVGLRPDGLRLGAVHGGAGRAARGVPGGAAPPGSALGSRGG